MRYNVVINKYFNRAVILFTLTLISVLLISQTAQANTISESFSAGGTFQKGTIVSVTQTDVDDIELTNINNSEYILGVVNDAEDSAVSFRKDNGNVSVALDGEVSVFVSDANGDISRGDFVGASWLEGVGMKAATPDRQKLVGVALNDFSRDSTGAEEYGEIDTDDGKKNIYVGTIDVRLFSKEVVDGEAAGDAGIQGALESIAGRDISLAKTVIGSLIFIVSLVVAGVFISSSIKGSFVSIGRNPMASQSIHKGMVRVSLIACVIVVIGALLSYVILII